MLTLAALEDTADVIYRFMKPTPQYSWPLLNEALGCEVWLKHENHAPTGSFKARSGIAYINGQILHHPRSTSFLAATRGNHGLSIAYAAHKFGYKTAAVVPKNSSPAKKAALRAWGSFLIEEGETYEEAMSFAQELAQDPQHCLVPSFHYDLVCGAGTYALELFRAVRGLDVVYVPVGLGNCICGLISARNILRLETKIVGVVAETADACAQSIERGELITSTHSHTFADGIAVRAPHPDALALIRAHAERVIRVSENQLAEAARLIFMTTHNVAEGAGAASLAGAMKEREALTGKRVGVILCGQNIEHSWLCQILQGETPHSYR